MPKQIELLEPGLAVPKGRGYVGVGEAGDTIYLPHLDSCCGIVGIFGGNRLIGGHIGAQWPGQPNIDYVFCGNRIFTLMEANRQRVNPGNLTSFVAVYPNNGRWAQVVSGLSQQWAPPAMLEIDTSNCRGGANVTVTATTVTVVDCKSNYTREYAIPTDEWDYKKETFPHQS